jgi:hypothetical protein
MPMGDAHKCKHGQKIAGRQFGPRELAGGKNQSASSLWDANIPSTGELNRL